jgi:hypothetical protein
VQPLPRDPAAHRQGRISFTTIVDIQVEQLQKLLADRKITLVLSDAARNWLADKGYDPAYRARPLKRVIQKNLQDPLAEEILGGNISDGETVEVGVGKDGLTLNRRPRRRKIRMPLTLKMSQWIIMLSLVSDHRGQPFGFSTPSHVHGRRGRNARWSRHA